MSASDGTSREQKGKWVFYTYSVPGQFSDVPGSSHACPQKDLGPSPEVMIQAEVNDWVHAGVEEGQQPPGEPAAGSAPAVCGSDVVLVEMHDDGAVAEDEDYDGENKSEECHEQAEALK